MVYLSLDKTYVVAGESFRLGLTNPDGSLGDTFNYTLSGPGITADNFIGETSLSGTITLGINNTGFRTFTTSTDFPTGDDYVTLTISSDSALNDMKLKVYSSYHYQTLDTKISLTDTFDIWRKKTNSFIARLDSIENSTNELRVQTIIANGTDDTYTLSFTIGSTNPYFFDVNIDGITQNPLDAYTIDDTNNAIVFSEVPPEDAEISITHQYSFGATFTEITDDLSILGNLSVGEELTISTTSTPINVNTTIADFESRLADLEFVPIDITSFNSAPSTPIYEYGGSTNYNLTFNWAVNKTPDTLSLSSPFSSPSLVAEDTSYVEPAFAVTNTTGAESSYTWILTATDTKGSDNATKTIRWVYPFFYGEDSNDLSGGTGIETLTKSISRKGDKTLGINATNEFIYFAYPASYGNLSIILDGNGFNVTSSFTKHTANVTPPVSGVARSYNIYKSNSVTTINQNFQFKF